MIEYQVDSKRIIGGRITELRKALGMNKTKFAEKLPVSHQAISAYESGRSGVSIGVMHSIAQIYGVSLKWLETGKGPMFQKNTPAVTESDISISHVGKQKLKLMPYLPISAQAGFVSSMEEDAKEYLDAITVPEEVYREYGKNSIVIEVQGDSMKPTLYPRAKVVVERMEPGSWQFMTSGVYVFAVGQMLIIKRIDKNTLHEGELTLVSDNPSVEDLTVQVSDIKSIFSVRLILFSPIY